MAGHSESIDLFELNAGIGFLAACVSAQTKRGFATCEIFLLAKLTENYEMQLDLKKNKTLIV